MTTELRFDGQVAIVTGAGGAHNLGRAHAKLLGARGAKVVVNDINLEGAERVAAEIVAEGGEAIADGRSISDPDSARQIVGAALDAWGRVDILVNNAGAMIFAEFDEMSDDDTRAIVDSHLLGTIWMSRAAWPHFKAQSYGRIVNTESSSYNGRLQHVVYGAVKSGLMGLTYSMASVGEPFGIKVNGVVPMAGTDAVARSLDTPSRAMLMQAPPELVAPLVAFISHPDCPVTGERIHAGGGRVFLAEQPRPRGEEHIEFAATPSSIYRNPQPSIEDIRDHWSEVIGDDWLPVDFGGEKRLTPTQQPYRP